MSYPEKPYIASAIVTFASGYKRDLVAFEKAFCTEVVTYDQTDISFAGQEIVCGNEKTFLDAGTPRCSKHLAAHCKHGYVCCSKCKVLHHWMKRIVRKIKPRPVKEL